MDNNTKLLGYILAGGVAYFMYRVYKSGGEEEAAPIEGLNIDINPTKLVDSITPWIPVADELKPIANKGAKHLINGFMMSKNKANS